MQILRMKIFKTVALIVVTAFISGGGVFLAMAGEVSAAVKAKTEAEAWVAVVETQAEQTLADMANYYAAKKISEPGIH